MADLFKVNQESLLKCVSSNYATQGFIKILATIEGCIFFNL
jgi:hypothetical protein